MSDTMDIGGTVEGSSPANGSGSTSGGYGSTGGLDTSGSGLSAVDLSGSTPGVNGAAALSALGQTLAALATLGYATNPVTAPLAVLAAAHGIVEMENQAAAGIAATMSANPDIANAQMGAFSAGSQ